MGVRPCQALPSASVHPAEQALGSAAPLRDPRRPDIGRSHAGVVELVDAPDSKSGSARSVGSSPTARTTSFGERRLAESTGAALVGRRVLVAHGAVDAGQALAAALHDVGALVLGPGDGEQTLALLSSEVQVDAAVLTSGVANAGEIARRLSARGTPLLTAEGRDPAAVVQAVADALDRR